MICGACGSPAGALVRIEGDPQGRTCFGCSRCGAVTSPISCSQRVKAQVGGLSMEVCPGHAVAFCSSCRKATCEAHLTKRKARGLRTGPPRCRGCSRDLARKFGARRTLPAPSSLWYSGVDA